MKKLLFLIAITLSGCGSGEFKIVAFNGHTYVLYDGHREVGMVHDPDCKGQHRNY